MFLKNILLKDNTSMFEEKSRNWNKYHDYLEQLS